MSIDQFAIFVARAGAQERCAFGGFYRRQKARLGPAQAVVEVAQRAVKADPHWKRLFTELERRMHRNQAIVAVARHLLTVVWSVLSQGKSYRHYSDERIAYKYYTWSWQLDTAQRNGLTSPQFVRYYLMRLGVGADLQHVALDLKHPHRLASESEILEMMTDLQPPG